MVPREILFPGDTLRRPVNAQLSKIGAVGVAVYGNVAVIQRKVESGSSAVAPRDAMGSSIWQEIAMSGSLTGTVRATQAAVQNAQGSAPRVRVEVQSVARDITGALSAEDLGIGPLRTRSAIIGALTYRGMTPFITSASAVQRASKKRHEFDPLRRSKRGRHERCFRDGVLRMSALERKCQKIERALTARPSALSA